MCFLVRCSFAGCNYQTHFSENLKKHSKIHAHAQYRMETKVPSKPDHSHVKRTRKSKKPVAIATMSSNITQTNSEFVYAGKSAAPESYVSSITSPTEMQVPTYRMSSLPTDSSAIKTHETLTGLLNDKLAIPVMTDSSQPLYQCQQYEELDNNSSSYISL